MGKSVRSPSSSRTIRTCSANFSVVLEPAPKNPSPWRTARFRAFGWLPPNHTGGPGFWNGFGSIEAPASCQNRPSRVTSDFVHSSRITCKPSVNREIRPSPSCPNAENCRPFPPAPTPASTRPRLSWSSVARLFARCTGLCSVVTNTAQPSRNRSVHAAA